MGLRSDTCDQSLPARARREVSRGPARPPDQILDGTYPAGEPLPHTAVLKETYGVGAHVITRSMKELKEQGLIWRVANKGMIVLGPAVSIGIPMAIERRDEPTAWAARRWPRAGTAPRRASCSGSV
ncbi:regulatory GntR family protein [Nonomuraea polychroma]|uniref:Regulatory GntR family protein n=2 Tax=Nonomuraea polychroma TaxID=46176 RepID=A0A438M0I0_9ACTN|nr:regulatory GntR family protein [Nonomuraea polychroma]